MKYFLFAFLAAIALPLAAAQSCTNYSGQICADVFNSTVFIPAGYDEFMLENKMIGYQKRFEQISYVQPECYQTLIPFLCLVTFNPCSDETPLPVATLPCASMCNETNTVCAEMFKLANFNFDCSVFPTDIIETPVPRQCSTSNFRESALPECPLPDMLARVDEIGVCTLRCDYNYYPEYQVTSLYNAEMTISVMSMVGAVCLCITYTIFPFKASHPSNLVLFISIASLGASIGQLLNFMPTEDIHCTDETTLADTHHPACGAQGALLHYFSISVACWWLCIAFNLHQMIVAKNTATYKLQKYYHIFSWGFPAVLTIVGISINTYQYSPASFRICFFAREDETDGLYTSWFLIFGIIGTGLIFHVSYKLYRSYVKMRGVSSVGHNVFRAQLRSYVFLAYYNWIVISLVSFILYTRSVYDEAQDDMMDYIKCAFGFSTPYVPVNECALDRPVSFSFVLYSVLIVFGQGAFLFATFMTTPDVIGCWKALIFEGRFDYDPRSHLNKTNSRNDVHKHSSSKDLKSSTNAGPSNKDLELAAMHFASSEAKASLGVD